MFIKKLERVSPLNLYFVLRELEHPFILMSAEKHNKKARFTYLSAVPEFIVSIHERGTYLDGKKVSKEKNPFKGLKGFMKHSVSGERFMGGLVGYIAYDAVHNYIEGNVEEPSVFGYYPWTYIYDHLENKLYFVSLEEPHLTQRLWWKRQKG